MKQLLTMSTLAKTFAKKLPTVLGSLTTPWMALACFLRTVNILTLSVKLASVVGKSAQLKTKVNLTFVLFCLALFLVSVIK